ncbi:MAG: tRNA guanosine(34) transglycosylase Tgt [Planctomycetota bacterium]
MEFELLHVDASCQARRSTLRTAHGAIQLPAFMPVGTQGTVKGVMKQHLIGAGAEIILGNTYHLELRPGAELIGELGGLHQFASWERPILTDSGGFQIFSLAEQAKITEQGASFRSHIDGREVRLTPERSMAIQEHLGSDIAMVLDHVVSLPADVATVRDACQRSIRWAARCQAAARRPDQALFAIVQGGLDPALRVWCAEQLVAMDFPGYAVGGLSVGEPPPRMYEMLDVTCPVLPIHKPRYLMGVGRPEDLLEGIRRGIDMFDCVMPTRNGRNALAFTAAGPVRLRNARFQRDVRPLEEGCDCPACGHSRAYLRHLFQAGEMLGPILLSIHNIYYYLRLMREARQAIERDEFDEFHRRQLASWQAGLP